MQMFVNSARAFASSSRIIGKPTNQWHDLRILTVVWVTPSARQMRLGLLYVCTQGAQQTERNGEWSESGEGAELTQISRIMLHTSLGNL